MAAQTASRRTCHCGHPGPHTPRCDTAMKRLIQGRGFTLLAPAILVACVTLAHAASDSSEQTATATGNASLQARQAAELVRKADFLAHQVNTDRVRRVFTGLDGHRVQCVD